MPIAVDISGDGKLPQSAATPGSNQATRYESLEIYLVSSQTNINLTISSGTGFLSQESGSTVKHLDYQIPSCVPAGTYNVTFYEGSVINNSPFYSITPITTKIDNTNQNGSCTSTNPLQTQPQASSPPPQSPFLPSGSGGSVTVYTGTGTVGGVTTIPGMMTVTVTSSGDTPWPLSSSAADTGSAVTVTVGATSTTTATPSEVSVTVIVVSMQTVTTTQPGQTTPVTTTETLLSTTTAIMNSPNAGFVPVNSAPSSGMAGLVATHLIAAMTAVFLCSRILW